MTPPKEPARPSVVELVAALRRSAEALASREDVAATEAPRAVLQDLAEALHALEAPVRALAGQAAQQAAEPYAGQELQEAVVGLRQAADCVRRAREEWQ